MEHEPPADAQIARVSKPWLNIVLSTRKGLSKPWTLIACISALVCAAPFHAALAQSAPDLGAAGSFAVLAGTAVTCTSSAITGDAGVNSGAVGACTVVGTVHDGDAVAQQAYADFLAAYDTLAAEPCEEMLFGTLAGATLPPKVYCFAETAALTGVLTLSGPSGGTWIFRIGTSGTGALQATNFNVALSGGTGCYNNVYWWTAQAATLTNTVFFGRVFAGTDVTVTTGGSVNGQTLAKGAVTLTGTSVSLDFCPVREVSPRYAVFPLRMTKDANSWTGFHLYFQRIIEATGYNLYEGDIGAWYSHGSAVDSVCNADVTDLGTGEMRAAVTPSEGDHYYLVTAYSGPQEGPSGFASNGMEIPAVLSTCAP